jgi:hypothetical protein
VIRWIVAIRTPYPSETFTHLDTRGLTSNMTE